jgi:hypothetical protein
LFSLAQVLAEPESRDGFSTNHVEVELEVRCGNEARCAGYEVDAADLEDLGIQPSVMRKTFSRQNGLFRFANDLR